LYRTGSSWTGSAASEASFLDEAGRAAIVHFAGHSISNDSQPRYAALAMSSTAARATPMLYAYQIAELEWPSTRLVVLSSCSSAAKTEVPSAVPISLADAFLDAHVPGIVATVWPIEDGTSISLVRELHKNLQAGRAAPAALRLAQIAALRSGDSQRASMKNWAPYCFIGWHSEK
jgi:CHAT domain-containing protein